MRLRMHRLPHAVCNTGLNIHVHVHVHVLTVGVAPLHVQALT